MRVEIARQPKKYLDKCTQSDYDKIYKVLSELPNLEKLQGKIKKIQGRENEYRIKLPPFRIIFKYDKVSKVITVIKIDMHGDVYKKG